MKGFGLFQRFCRIGVSLVFLLTGIFISRAQTSGGPVGPPITPFQVFITSPQNDAAFPVYAKITISATATNSSSFINTMFFYSGTNLLKAWVIDPVGPGQSNYSLTLSFDWTNVPAGAYTLTAVAHNTDGISVTSPPVNITVGPARPVVTIVATDPIASMAPGDTGTFTLYRSGGTSNSLEVFYGIGGTASNGVDYVTINNNVVIPAGASSAPITITPIKDPFPDPNETVALRLVPSPLGSPLPDYKIGAPSNAVVTILGTNSIPPIVSIIATDPIAVEPGTNRIVFQPMTPTFTNYCTGTNTATFLVRRISPTATGIPPSNSNDVTVYYNISGTASNGVDYATLPGFVTIPAGKNYALITVDPLEDTDPSVSPPFSTVILSLVVPPTDTNVPPPYILGWPNKAGAIILEERLYPIGPPIGPIAGGPFPCAPFYFHCPATNGMNYCLEVSSDLINWLPVCTNTVVKSSIHFVDPDACGCTNRYYRAVPVAATPLY